MTLPFDEIVTLADMGDLQEMEAAYTGQSAAAKAVAEAAHVNLDKAKADAYEAWHQMAVAMHSYEEAEQRLDAVRVELLRRRHLPPLQAASPALWESTRLLAEAR